MTSCLTARFLSSRISAGTTSTRSQPGKATAFRPVLACRICPCAYELKAQASMMKRLTVRAGIFMGHILLSCLDTGIRSTGHTACLEQLCYRLAPGGEVDGAVDRRLKRLAAVDAELLVDRG